MTHGDTVIHGNGVEFFGNATSSFNFTRDQLTQIFEVNVTRYELREGIHHRNNRFAEIAIFHAGGAPE